MPSSPTDLNVLARRVLLLEGGDERTLASVVAGTEATFAKLLEDLALMVGPGGASAMASRALRQAQRTSPLLEGIATDPAVPPRLTGVSVALSRGDPEEAEAAAAAAIECLFELLVALLGRNLGLRPVRRLWPAAFHEHEPDPNEEEA